jgi:hypothetical protein
MLKSKSPSPWLVTSKLFVLRLETNRAARGRPDLLEVRTNSKAGVRCYAIRLRQDVADPADLGADGFQFFFDFFVAAVDVVDAVDDGFAIGD